MGVLGGVFVLKSGLSILIRTPKVPFSVPPKTPKMGHFGEGGISPLPPVGRCHPVNLKTDLVEVEDKFVAISYPKTPQRIHFL